MVEFYHAIQIILFYVLYKLDSTLVVDGLAFNLPYDGGLFFNTYYNEAENRWPSSPSLDAIVYVQWSTIKNSYIPAEVIGVPLQNSDAYTL